VAVELSNDFIMNTISVSVSELWQASLICPVSIKRKHWAYHFVKTLVVDIEGTTVLVLLLVQETELTTTRDLKVGRSRHDECSD